MNNIEKGAKVETEVETDKIIEETKEDTKKEPEEEGKVVSHNGNERNIMQELGEQYDSLQEKMKNTSSEERKEEVITEMKRIEKEIGEMKKIFNYLERTLEGELVDSFISRPMNQDCKVAVMIPVYNENFSNILRSLSSLAEQKEVNPNLFEVDFIINNSRENAEKNDEIYLQNKESLSLIKFINGESQKAPQELTPEQLKQVERIKESKINVNVINKISLENAEKENNVGVARNRAGAEILQRYIESSGDIERVIAITDCDCTFSNNFISSLIYSFENYKINGVSGELNFEVDYSLQNKELVKKAFDIYMGKSENKEDYSKELNLRPQEEGVLESGANMAVTGRVWGLVEGMPEKSGGEDTEFGKRVKELEGTVWINYDYTVTSLIRESERTGLQANGRIVKKIKESIEKYIAGEEQKIVIEDREKMNGFFTSILEAGENKYLSGELIISLMEEYDFKENNISSEEYDRLAQEINNELGKAREDQDTKRIEKSIEGLIYPYYPEKDITDKIIEKR
jgi:hypothetical protein